MAGHIIITSCFSLQKLAQLNEEQHQHLHDLTCLWVYIMPRLEETFPGNVVQKHLQMFWDGILGPVKPVTFW